MLPQISFQIFKFVTRKITGCVVFFKKYTTGGRKCFRTHKAYVFLIRITIRVIYLSVWTVKSHVLWSGNYWHFFISITFPSRYWSPIRPVPAIKRRLFGKGLYPFARNGQADMIRSTRQLHYVDNFWLKS